MNYFDTRIKQHDEVVEIILSTIELSVLQGSMQDTELINIVNRLGGFFYWEAIAIIEAVLYNEISGQ